MPSLIPPRYTPISNVTRFNDFFLLNISQIWSLSPLWFKLPSSLALTIAMFLNWSSPSPLPLYSILYSIVRVTVLKGKPVSAIFPPSLHCLKDREQISKQTKKQKTTPEPWLQMLHGPVDFLGPETPYLPTILVPVTSDYF